MLRVSSIVAALCLAVGIGAVVSAQNDDKAPKAKHTIKVVMKKAMGGGAKSLLSKVKSGKASKEEKDQLLDLTISLLDNKPKKGDQGSWIGKAGRLTVAAARVAVGRKGAEKELAAAANCGACHKAHK